MTTTTPTLIAPEHDVRPIDRSDGFHTVASDHTLGENVPQRVGNKLWLPMFAMAIMGCAVGIVLAIVEASTSRSEAETIQTLGHLVPAFMFIGFLGVFSAITFAVARILGVLRRGGGEVQEVAHSEVQTLRMPGTAKAMLGFMMMGMMVMGAGIVTNFVGAVSFDGLTAAELADSSAVAAAASGLRRMGVGLYLTGIAFGLGTIIEVLRFQAIRIREVAQGHNQG